MFSFQRKSLYTWFSTDERYTSLSYPSKSYTCQSHWSHKGTVTFSYLGPLSYCSGISDCLFALIACLFTSKTWSNTQSLMIKSQAKVIVAVNSCTLFRQKSIGVFKGHLWGMTLKDSLFILLSIIWLKMTPLCMSFIS